MIRIDKQITEDIKASRRKEDLYPFLQKAVELEHATIPAYLTAMYSLIPGANDTIASLIQSIVTEEMLHMTIAANITVAIGGSPQINNRKFVLSYPGPLPMGIGDLIVPIKAFSRLLVKGVFRRIERPERPIPIGHLRTFSTVGEFYAAIQNKIRDLGDEIFVVGAERQVLSWFHSDLLFPILDAASAIKAIDIIVRQGEGTYSSPFESPGELAHYYRFGEIYYGRKLIKTARGYAYRGDPIPFDRRGVYPMIENPSLSDYPRGSHVETLSRTFTCSYSSLLNALHASFNGAPRTIGTAIGLMQQLRLQAQTLMSTPLRHGGRRTAGPVFRYVTSQ